METWLSMIPVLSLSLTLAMSCYVLIRSGEMSFGQQAFFGIGAYVAAICTAVLETGILFALLCGTAVATLVALVAGLAALRASGFQFTIFTLVFGEFMRELLAKFRWQIERDGRLVGPDGALGFSGIDYFHESRSGPEEQALLLGFSAAACAVCVWALFRSRLGQAIDAVATDSVLAASVGINPRRVRLYAFCIAGLLAGIGGGLFAHYTTYIDPNNFSLMLGVHAVAYTLIGGIGSVLGPIVGTVVDVVFLEWLRAFGAYRMVAFGVLIVAMMIWRPQGLLGARVIAVPTVRTVGRHA